MPQNIYDNPAFFERYAQLDRSLRGLDGAPEWPVLRQMLPDLRGQRVLDLGCGFGWFCRWAAAAGASEVLGLDLSENMLGRARSLGVAEGLHYRRADLDALELEAGDVYDLVFSSLTLHYLRDLPTLFGKIRRALRPGGHFVLSVEHPILLAPTVQQWQTLASGAEVWPLDRYLEEGPRRVDWLVDGVEKVHRTVASYLNLASDQGLVCRHMEEWGPSVAQIAAQSEWARERNRPYFLLMSVQSETASA